MSVRPEGSNTGGYDRLGDESYDADAWQEFTPWRPGDASTAGEAPPSYTADYVGDGLYRPSLIERTDGREQQVDAAGAGSPTSGEPRRFRWTEDNPQPLRDGERVRATGAVGGNLFSTVPTGTKGRVVSTSSTVFGTEKARVEFENGYTEDVKVTDLERRGWFD